MVWKDKLASLDIPTKKKLNLKDSNKIKYEKELKTLKNAIQRMMRKYYKELLVKCVT